MIIFNIINVKYINIAYSIALVVLCASMLCACGSGSDEAMWNSYDYRYAAPSIDSNDSYYSPPQGYGATSVGGYQDNDSSYNAPKTCAPNSPDACY